MDAHWPGSVHDSRVWRNSNLCTAVEQGIILNGPTVNVRGVHVPQQILADQGYPLTDNVLIPFREYMIMGRD